MRLIFSALLWVLLTNAALAAIDTYQFDSEEQSERFRQLTTELRCPKCQNQDLADSNAPIAADLRKQIYEQLRQGKNNSQIIDFMVDRYGDFVRYKPAVTQRTWLLWFGPALLLGLGVLSIALIVMRRRRPQALAGVLSAEEQARLDQLLDNPNK